jgi:hypothetical protein
MIDDARSVRPLPFHTAAIVAVAAALAAAVPLDRGFALLPANSGSARGAWMLALALSGLFFAGKAGLRTAPHDVKRPLVASILIALALAAAIAALDAGAPQAIVLPGYLDGLRATPTLVRLEYFGVRAFGEDVVYRLFLMSLLAFAGARLLRNDKGSIPVGVYWLAIVAAQIANATLNCWADAPLTPALAIYTLVRFFLPGALWGYLYWRQGFLMATLAHVATHVFYQPLMTLALG